MPNNNHREHASLAESKINGKKKTSKNDLEVHMTEIYKTATLQSYPCKDCMMKFEDFKSDIFVSAEGAITGLCNNIEDQVEKTSHTLETRRTTREIHETAK